MPSDFSKNPAKQVSAFMAFIAVAIAVFAIYFHNLIDYVDEKKYGMTPDFAIHAFAYASAPALLILATLHHLKKQLIFAYMGAAIMVTIPIFYGFLLMSFPGTFKPYIGGALLLILPIIFINTVRSIPKPRG